MVARSRQVAEPRWSREGRFLAWVEAFDGRADVVVAPADVSGPPRTVTADAPAKSVAAYGGGVFDWARGGTLVYAAADGRLLALPHTGGPPRPLTREGRASAPATSPDGSRVAFVLEGDDTCDIAVVPLDGSAWPVRLTDGADYAFDPAWSPDGTVVVWHEWDFPHMPWDESRIVGRAVDGLVPSRSGPQPLVARPGVAVGQPRFSPDGSHLAFVSDETGWPVVWTARPDGSRATPVVREEREHALPTWGPGQRSYAWAPGGGELLVASGERGFGRLLALSLRRGRVRELGAGWYTALDASPAGLVACRSAPGVPLEVVVVDPRTGAERAVARGPVAGIEEVGLPEPEAVVWTGADGGLVHGLLWRPRPAAVPPGRKPPLLVVVHGGPTSQARAGWDPRLDFWRDRGWAVLTPNHRGSTGYGRAYREALAGRWGDLDVSDTAAGIRHAKDAGWCEPDRVAVTGGSAGGFTTVLLCALHGDLVRAGVSAFGVTDLFHLAETTHRFESRYLDGLVGALPEAADRYRDRSPVTHAGAIRVPLLVLHGSEDRAVPLAQAQALVAAVRAAGGEVEEHVYEGEGHGWSRPATVEDELARTERFLCRHVLLR